MLFIVYALSITIAEAPPPPLQIAAAPNFALFCARTLIKVTIILAPEHPSGWPNETAPPFTFTLSLSNPKILAFAKPTTEKASLNSKKSTSEIEIPALSNAFGNAFAGAVVNHLGSCAASAYDFIKAKGFKPNSFAFSLLSFFFI